MNNMNQVVYGNQFMGGMVPAGNIKKPNYCNPLGEEKIKRLLANGNGLPKLTITEEDLDRAICTHRHNGESTLIQLPSGEVQCKICGARFNVIENASAEDIQQATQNLHDLLHTAKIMMVDAPESMIVENFQIISVVDKVPEIYAIAKSSYDKFVSTNPQLQQYGGSQMNGANLWSQILGGGFAMNQQPNYGYQQPAANYGTVVGYAENGLPIYGQPQAAPNPAQAAMVAGSNGMGVTSAPQYTAPQQAPTPNTTGQQATVTTNLTV